MANCILELKLVTTKWQEDVLAHTFRCAERMYNTMVRHAKNCLKQLQADNEYKLLLSSYINCPNTEQGKKDKKQIGKLLNKKVKEYHLSEFDFHAYIAKMKKESYYKVLDIDTAQKLATRVWTAVEKVLYSTGKDIHFKKRGSIVSIESKKNTAGIKFDKNTLTCKFKGMVIPVKIRQNDTYAQELLTHKICYCRIVRKPFKSGYKYFLQLVLDGIPPQKHSLGSGNVGIDMGTSTIAAIGDDNGFLVAHGNNMSKNNNQTVTKYNKEIIQLTRKLERQRRLNNPQNYNVDGTIKKGANKWIKTKGYYKTLFALKDAYRKKTAFIIQQHNITANRIIALGDTFTTEPMDWKALQARAKNNNINENINIGVLQQRGKKTEKSDKTTVIKKKDGSTRTVKKYKKRKRFGKSLNKHSPAKQEEIINRKLSYFNKQMQYVNLPTYRASQYNPETCEYTKCGLDIRFKEMYNQLIQRDLLSAFLLQNPLDDLENIDTVAVQNKIKQFIKIHNKIITELKNIPNLPKCIGI